MPWTSQQLPWTFQYTPPARPDGPFEPLNWLKGPPIMLAARTPAVYHARAVLKGSKPPIPYHARAILRGSR